MSVSTTNEPIYVYSTCAHLTIPTVIINTIIALTILFISIVGYYKMVHASNQFSKNVSRAQHLFYIMCIVYSISRIPDVIGECWYPHSLFKWITYILCIVSYYFHWIALLLILYLRMSSVFHSTSLQVTKCCNIISLFILVGSIPFGFLVLALAAVWFTFTMFAMAFNLLILIIFSQCLTFTFIYKLYKLNKSQKDNFSDKTKHNRLVNIMTKYTILTIVSLVASTATLLVLIIVSFVFVFYNPEMYLLTLVAQMLDVLVDSVAVSLTMKFNEKYYVMLCNKMDKICKSCCFSVANGGKHTIALSRSMSSNTQSKEQPKEKTITTSPSVTIQENATSN
eukprot:509551_1